MENAWDSSKVVATVDQGEFGEEGQQYEGFLDDLQAKATSLALATTNKLVASGVSKIEKSLGIGPRPPPPPPPQQSYVYQQPQIMAPPPPQIIQQSVSAPLLTEQQKKYAMYGGAAFGGLMVMGIIYKVFLKGDPMAKMMQMMAMQRATS